jgi:hypothetical protein
MFERMIGRAGRIGKARARARTAQLSERLRAELPRGITAEETEAGVRLVGRGLARCLALEPALRWLTAALR